MALISIPQSSGNVTGTGAGTTFTGGQTINQLGGENSENRLITMGKDFLKTLGETAQTMFAPEVWLGEKIVETGAELFAKPVLRTGIKYTVGGFLPEETEIEGLGRITPAAVGTLEAIREGEEISLEKSFRDLAADWSDLLMTFAFADIGLALGGRATTALATGGAKVSGEELLKSFGTKVVPTITKLKELAAGAGKTASFWGTVGGLHSYGEGNDWAQVAHDTLVSSLIAGALHLGISGAGMAVEKIRFKPGVIEVTSKDMVEGMELIKQGRINEVSDDVLKGIGTTLKNKQEFLQIAEEMKGQNIESWNVPIKIKRDLVGWFKNTFSWIPEKMQSPQITRFLKAAETVTDKNAPALYEQALNAVGARSNPFMQPFFGENRMLGMFKGTPSGIEDPAKFAQLQQGVYGDPDGDIELPDNIARQIEREASQEAYLMSHEPFVNAEAESLGKYKKVIPGLETMDWSSAMNFARNKLETKPTATLQEFVNKYGDLDTRIQQEWGVEEVPDTNEVFSQIVQRSEEIRLGEYVNPMERQLVKLDDKMKQWVNTETTRLANELATQEAIRDIYRDIEPGELVRVKERTLLKEKSLSKIAGARIGYWKGKKMGVKMTKDQVRQVQLRQRARKELRGRVNKAVKDIKKVDTKKMLPRYKKEIDALKENVDLTRMTEKTFMRLGNMKEYFDENPELVQLSDDVKRGLERIEKQNVGDMTVDEIEGLRDAIKHFQHLNKRSQTMMLNQKAREIDEVVGEMTPEIVTAGKYAPLETDIISSKQKYLPGLASKTKNMLTKGQAVPEVVFGEILTGKSGTKTQDFFYGQADRATDTELNHYFTYKDKIANRLQSDVKYRTWSESGYIERLGTRSYRRIMKVREAEWVPMELPDMGKIEMTKAQRVTMYMYSKNPNARKKLLTGGITFRAHAPGLTMKVYPMTERDLNAFLNTITSEEREMAEFLWKDVLEPMGDETAKVFENVNGYTFKREENYLPLKVFRKDEGDLWTQGKIKMKDTLGNMGFLKERVEGKIPVVIEDVFNTVHRHIEQTGKYTAWVEPIRNMKAVLARPEFQKDVIDNHGTAMWTEITSFVKDMESVERSISAYDNAVSFLASRIAPAVLTSPTVMSNQLLSIFLSAIEVEEKYLIEASARMRKNKVVNYWNEKSPQLRYRHDMGYDRDIVEVMADSKVAKDFFGVESLPAHIMTPVQWFDELPVYTTAEAVRIKYEQQGKPLDENMVKAAEEAVIRSQTTSLMKDRPRFLRDASGTLRLFTLFQTQLNKIQNQARRTINQYANGEIGKSTLSKNFAYIILSSAVGMALVRRVWRAFRNIGKDKQDIPVTADVLAEVLKLPPSLFGLAPLTDPGIDKVVKGYMWDSGVNSPQLELVGQATSVPTEFFGELFDMDVDGMINSLEDVIDVTGKFTGLPLKNIEDYGGTLLRLLYQVAGMSIEELSEIINASDTTYDPNSITGESRGLTPVREKTITPLR